MPGSHRETEAETTQRLEVRRARDRDVAAIVALWQNLQQSNTAYDKRLTTNASASGWYEDFLRQQLEMDNSAVFVAESDSVVVGYTFGQIMQRPTLAEGDCGYVADLCVADAHRGKGIGRRLYYELRSWFSRHGIKHVEVQVVRGNPASQAFWRKMGFGEFLRTLRCDM
jgi:ribosomal protein S18 acetylase RimI-like enzyme